MRKTFSLLALVAVLGAFASGCASQNNGTVYNKYPYHPGITPALTTSTYAGYGGSYICPFIPGCNFQIFEGP